MASRVTDGTRSSADRLLADITSVLVSEGSPERVFEAVADALRELVPYDTLTIYRAVPTRRLVPVLLRDGDADRALPVAPIGFGVGIVGAAAEAGTAELIDDVREDARAPQTPGAGEGRQAMIVVPVKARGELKGMLCLSRTGATARFDREELQLATRFAGIAAVAIDNADVRARLEDEVVTDHLTALHNHRYFHERLAEEMRRVHRTHLSLGLLIIDIDDFKRTNDRFGHLEGDRVLQSISALFREVSREEDVVCRIGGEEFAIILPVTSPGDTHAVAERIRAAVERQVFVEGERVTVSVGVAGAPDDASSPRELFRCADDALRLAKTEGKNRVRRAGQRSDAPIARLRARTRRRRAEGGSDARLRVSSARDGTHALAQLKVVHALARRLNRLTDVGQVAGAIATELRDLIDYHDCRVYELADDRETLVPIGFRGDPTEYEGDPVEALMSRVGEGITGRVVATGESLYVPNARHCEFAVQIPGTQEIDESILAVPLGASQPAAGAIVLSKLGTAQFDEGDLLLLETLASHAFVALDNARLFQREKEAGEASRALFDLSQRLTQVRGVTEVLTVALAAIPGLIACSRVEAWMPSGSGDSYRLLAHRGYPEEQRARLDGMVIPGPVATPFIGSTSEPFVIPKELLALGPEEYRRWDEELDILGTPMRWEPNGLGGVAIVAPSTGYRFTARDVELARGLSDITSLALANAHRFEELDRVYVSTIEALAGALEAQDKYTSDHAHALAEMAVEVGETFGLDDAALRDLELAALFHDIGKIGVPSEIIRKPGPLTDEERAVMDQHTVIGEQILAPVPFLEPIRPIVRACHERWDGGGYPDGLAGEEIPLAARIVFVCDAFHAMTTDRPYRRALPHDEAVRRLEDASGTQFDPAVVAAFVGSVAGATGYDPREGERQSDLR
jgi:diguanylate cyclase (GGDEF)-like protein